MIYTCCGGGLWEPQQYIYITMLLWKRQKDIHLLKIQHDMNHGQSVYISDIPPAGVRRFMEIYPSGLRPSYMNKTDVLQEVMLPQ